MFLYSIALKNLIVFTLDLNVLYCTDVITVLLITKQFCSFKKPIATDSSYNYYILRQVNISTNLDASKNGMDIKMVQSSVLREYMGSNSDSLGKSRSTR